MAAAFIQSNPRFGLIEENVEEAVKKMSGIRADIVVLPELFSTGYQFRSKAEALKYSENVPGGFAEKRLSQAARENRSYIVAGIAEKSGARAYNSAMLIGPNGLIAVYRKAHLFAGEKLLFSKGNTAFDVYDIGGVRIGMMICFDWFFPEAARTLALKGADIICHPSNLVLPYCPAAMLTRCLENRVFAITANRVGCEERVKGKPLNFIGQSQIVAPDGKVLYRASDSKEEARVIGIDIEKARNKNLNELNDIFKDRRPGLYKS
ncbi:MAG: acyltransferase [Deltaproteobacteria bacterium]|nr:acyltransferase [Deltaproteobacteria bacterium]